MRILYVCHRFPFPPKRGGKIRPFNMIRHLHERGHEVTVASLARSAPEAAEAEGIAAHCSEHLLETVAAPAAMARMLIRLPTPVPSSMGYFYSPKLAAGIRKALREKAFDLIFVHCSSVAQYVEDIAGIPKMLDFGDMDSKKWQIYAGQRSWPLSWGYGLEGLKLERYEKRLAAKFDFCTCTTRAEFDTLNDYGTGAATGWFPNGVDADYFRPDVEAREADTICFVGRMDYYPNQQAMFEFCADVLPLLKARRPGIKLLIVGAEPSPAVRQLGEDGAVTVTGSVPDVRPFVRRAQLTVAPLRIARGTQNKILESMAMGTPVITTSAAAGGVDAVPGEHLLVADDAAGMTDHIDALLADPTRARELGARARARVLSHHDWEKSMLRLDALIDRCIEQAVLRAAAPRTAGAEVDT